MEEGVGRGIGSVPLARLIPELTDDDVRRIVEAGAAIDAARTDDRQWGWWLASNVYNFHLCVNERHSGGDEYYLELDVGKNGADAVLEVEANVNVVCWCAKDHQFHNIVEVEQECQDTAELADAFERTATQIVAWLQDTHDPVRLRTRVGLPSREVS